MRYCLFFLILLCVYNVISDDNDLESEEETHRKRVLEQLTKTRTVLLDGYHLVTRQTATNIFMFRSYRTVSVIFYNVMRDVTDARFFFQAEEVHWNNIGENFHYVNIAYVYIVIACKIYANLFLFDNIYILIKYQQIICLTN